MLALARFFWEMSLLRRLPQDVPFSPTLLGVVLVVNLVVGALGTTQHFGGFGQALLASIMDAAVVALLVYATLRIAGNPARFLQTLTAFFGIALLFSIVMLLLQTVMVGLQLPELLLFANVALLAWIHVALGHVLRHALDIELWAGIGIAVAYTVIGLVVVGSFFPPIEVTAN